MKIKNIHAFITLPNNTKTFANENCAVIERERENEAGSSFIVATNVLNLHEHEKISWEKAKHFVTLMDALEAFTCDIMGHTLSRDHMVEDFTRGLSTDITTEQAIRTLIRDEILSLDHTLSEEQIKSVEHAAYFKADDHGMTHGSVLPSELIDFIDQEIEQLSEQTIDLAT